LSKSLVKSIYSFKKNYIELESWKKWYLDLVLDKPVPYKAGGGGRRGGVGSSLTFGHKQRANNDDDELAVEVLVYRKNLIDFAGL
jgi:hypothetical protein